MTMPPIACCVPSTSRSSAFASSRKSGARATTSGPARGGLVHGSYLILYEYDAARDMVTIVTVVEGMRDLNGLF